MISDYYANTYTIYTNSGSVDANGDYTEAASVLSSGKCKLDALSGAKLIRLNGKQEVWANYRMYIAPGVALDEFDNITIDDNLYQIVFVAKRINSHQEVDLYRIK